MLTDMGDYKSKEDLINALRRQRDRGKTDNGITSPGGDVRGTVQFNQGDNRGNEGTGGGTSQQVYGGNGSTRDGTVSSDNFGGRPGYSRPGASAGDSGSRQHLKSNVWQQLKGVVGQYKSVFYPTPTIVDEAPKRGRKPANISVSNNKRPLSDAEAMRLRPKLIEFMEWQTEHMDNFITATTKGHHPVEIWGTMDRGECEIIVDFMISMARVDVRAAVAVRYASVFIDRLKVGVIIAPRVYATLMVYMKQGFSIR